jgi:NAD dependent epimerase/dehydratase family enzyme
VLNGRFAQPAHLLAEGFSFEFPDPKSALADLLA